MEEVYEVQTFNDAEASENKIHSDDIASRFGFEGALVGGVVVFGHMTWPPIKAEGENWLTNNQAEVKFLKPAYDRQMLTIKYEPNEDGAETRCFNPTGTLLSTMTHKHGEFEPNPLHEIPPAREEVVREEISWDNLLTDKPAPAYSWQPDYDTNLAFARQIEDGHSLYREGDTPLVHPFWMLRQCNSAFTRSFILPAWIHVGSKITFHKPLRVGQEIEVRMVPIDKWERKGHQFTTLYIPFLVDDEVYVEVEHTSIFRIASAEDQ
ncbi:MAG: hypothetical protein HUJ31_10440 [Pseudomonadales bacterium]|nr:hypothetical protein [Pseudomonadales bacterium]